MILQTRFAADSPRRFALAGGIAAATFLIFTNGNWRYVLGYEPAFMTDADFKVYHSVLWNSGDIKADALWLEKMTPADRFVIRGEHSSKEICHKQICQ